MRIGKGPNIANRQVKYFLRRWFYLDSNLEYLNSVDAVQMKILYAALKEITPEERQFLADKYRVSKKPYLKDDVLAKRYGIALKDYRNKRITVEDKLNPIIKKYSEVHHDELKTAIRLEHQK